MKKHNRKLMAVLCLLIAFKCTEAYGGFLANETRFMKLMADFKTFGAKANQGEKDRFLSRPLIFYELKVLSALNFQTTVPLKFILPHLDAIIGMLDTSLPAYLGEEAYNELL